MGSSSRDLSLTFRVGFAPSRPGPIPERNFSQGTWRRSSGRRAFEPNGSKAEEFGLETEPTSATRRNQIKFQVSPAPLRCPIREGNFGTNRWQKSPKSFEIRLFDILRFVI